MKPKSLVLLVIILLTSNCILSFNYVENCKADDVTPKFYIDDDYNESTPGWQVDHFNYIQDAINLSSSGNRIIVYAGSYYEALSIDKKLDVFGEDKDITTIYGSDSGNRITITAEYVNISHFTIKNSGNGPDNAVISINTGYAIITDNIIRNGENGISINSCNSNTIYDNTISNNNGNGIRLNHSNSNEITYNTITSNINGLFLYDSSNNIIQNNSAIQSNTKNGLFLNETSNYNIISDNTISSNSKNGIFLNDHCDYNTLSRNQISNNEDSGVRLENSSSNTVDNSTVSSNDNYGIMVVGSNNEIWYNTINSNGEHGVFLFADNDNVISRNTISSNTNDGISLSNSTADLIYTNEIYSNSRYGINLDFFTLSNTIYNNYFHDNSDNSMDKSLNHNIWNIAKISGTNIVQGSYFCGNYWDDFDETSEGITDPDGDGISNTNYTIYASNKDYGPLLDVTPPSVGTPSASPNSQTAGSYTYISVTITDNTELKDVYLNVVNPNSQTSNFSILQNKTGNIYYCNKKFSQIGTYTFHIAAKDPRNWATSTTRTFYINEGTPPTVTDNSPTTGSPSSTFIFNATVTDDKDTASDLTVKVHWSHGNNGGNHSMENVYGNFFEMEASLDNSTEGLTYRFWASDQWGNSVTTAQKTASIRDSDPPNIVVNTFGPSADNMPNKYTFGATITDNVEVTEVNIEYWYGNNDHLTVEMDKKDDNYFEKDIQLDESTDRVYCIIYATDPSGNQNDTKNPFANASGPYTGVTTIKVNFDATNSFDLDSSIANYTWNFGDGTIGYGETTSHIYSSNGNFTVTLTLLDSDGNTGIDTTYALIIKLIVEKTTASVLNELEEKYDDIELSELFYAYDTDGDGIVDKFIDPNDELQVAHTGNINISGNIVFLLSINDTYIPEFMWNSTTNKIVYIDYLEKTIDDDNIQIDEENGQATVVLTVDKTGWIWIDINDKYPHATISITAENRTISSDMIWRKNDKIYILDDPATNYTIIFEHIYEAVKSPTFFPPGSIDENQKTITITYNVPVTITYATFSDYRIESELKTTDNMVFTYTPPGYWDEGTYILIIEATAIYGNSQVTSETIYVYSPYTLPPPPPEKSFIEQYLIWIILSAIGGAGAGIYLFIRYKKITFESFVYIKNKKITPFFKPLVFGPLRIDVNDKRVKKAEFYVNGELKDTITQGPFVWNWNETSFMKKTIETKTYDEEGNSNSSGEMTFYVFNSPKIFK